MAIPRAYPLYSRKTVKNPNGMKQQRKLTIEFSFVGDDNTPLDQSEVEFLNAAADAVRLTARIVDAPCNDMNTLAFLEVHLLIMLLSSGSSFFFLIENTILLRILQ